MGQRNMAIDWRSPDNCPGPLETGLNMRYLEGPCSQAASSAANFSKSAAGIGGSSFPRDPHRALAGVADVADGAEGYEGVGGRFADEQ